MYDGTLIIDPAVHVSIYCCSINLPIMQDSSVKRAFLKHSAARLCVFFGPQRAKEVILSHMITFLNDKVEQLIHLRQHLLCYIYRWTYIIMLVHFPSLQTDWELHRAFFECIVDVATQLRHHSLPILEPLLQQVQVYGWIPQYA